MNKPLLPDYLKLEPYLRRIDENRYYSNFGALNAEYQTRISELFECPCITGSSATSLITAALMALDLPKDGNVAMPSYTFPATAAAVVSAGHHLNFLDVSLSGHLFQAPFIEGSTKAVIVVAPFGAPLDMKRWDNFDCPVIIDAAAGFDAFSTICKPAKVPVIISTHATKAFGTGEGGLIFSHDDVFLERVRRITNFGLTPDRRIEYTGLNAKFSEYHAAIGLAELDGWKEKREKLLAKTKHYGLDYAVTQVPVRVSDYPNAKMGVYGCHVHKAYAGYPRTDLRVTESLISNVGTVIVGID